MDNRIATTALFLCLAAGVGAPAAAQAAFADRIIGGSGAFVVTADNPSTFADAVRRKLVLEIAGNRTHSTGEIGIRSLLGRAAGDLPRNRFLKGVAYR